MNSPAVLIISQLQEPSTDLVFRHLEELGVRSLRVNSEEFAFGARCAVQLSQTVSSYTIAFDKISISSGEICAVWHRRWTYPVYPSHFSEATISFCFSETTGMLGGLPAIAPVLWINSIHSERRASNKLVQLESAKALGFRIPRTLVTNDASAIKDFAASNGGDLIFKPVSGSSILYRSYSEQVISLMTDRHSSSGVNEGQPRVGQVLYTQRLTTKHLQEIDTLRWSPVIFQELIKKSADVRVTVVGKALFPCLIHSQEFTETTIDFRVMNEGIDLRHEVVELPDNVVRFIHNLMEALSLEFGCLDFIIDRATGEYIFLEVNPAGQWLWVEAKTGMQISRAIAHRLSAPSTTLR